MTPEDYLTYGQVKRTPQGVTMGKTGAQFFNYAKSPEQQQPVVEANAYFDVPRRRGRMGAAERLG